MFHALDVFEIVRLLNVRKASEVDAGPQAPGRTAYPRQFPLALRSLFLLSHNPPEPFHNQSIQCAPLSGRLAFGAVQQFCGKTDGRSLVHALPTLTRCRKMRERGKVIVAEAGDRLAHQRVGAGALAVAQLLERRDQIVDTLLGDPRDLVRAVQGWLVA